MQEKDIINMYHIENTYKKDGHKYICGVDEAGRGPLAGPVCAAAVILNEDDEIKGLNDSKKLTPKKREVLFDEIKSRSLAYSVVFVDHIKIDKINILNATMEAMSKAILSLSIKPSISLIDGDKTPKLADDYDMVSIIEGDSKSASIAAASILAKVSRDRHMIYMDELFPEYGFKSHKGYGTKAHYQALEVYGPSKIHRQSFLKSYYTKLEAKTLGELGEVFVSQKLKEDGYKIEENNFISPYGEIDIIASKDDELLIVEVKTYTKGSKIAPRDAVTKSKQEKIIKTLICYLQEKNKNSEDYSINFDVFEIIASRNKERFIAEEVTHIKQAFDTTNERWEN